MKDICEIELSRAIVSMAESMVVICHELKELREVLEKIEQFDLLSLNRVSELKE
jgi:hypothetical protein